jgi:hypothetical protein
MANSSAARRLCWVGGAISLILAPATVRAGEKNDLGVLVKGSW